MALALIASYMRRFTISSCYRLKIKINMDYNVDLSDMRTQYNDTKHVFSEENLLHKEPIGLFGEWFELASKTKEIREPNAMVLATANKEGKPSARFVLLKGFGKEGFKFFSSYESRKGKEIAENPHVSLVFYWEPIHRQVRIEGCVTKLSKEESEEYFHSRPRSSQISCAVSKQSSTIPSREKVPLIPPMHDAHQPSSEESDYLIEQTKKFEDVVIIPKPQHWGGFLVKPEVIEFWQGQTNRLHDRIRFCREDNKINCPDLAKHGENGWMYERLSP